MLNIVKLGFFGYDNTGNENQLFQQFLGMNEEIRYSFRGIRDELIFTNKRAIMLNIQGLTGKKKEFRFFEYKKLNSYAIETSGTIDLDSEIKFVIGSIEYHFELGKGIDVMSIGRLIANMA